MKKKTFDFYLLLPVIFLLGFGVGIIVSVFPVSVLPHLIYILLGLLFFTLFSFLDLKILFPLSPVIYLCSLFFLFLPLALGTVTRGATRWISVAGLTVQPSEIIKPFLAVVIASFWASRKFSFRNLLIFGLLFLPVLGLIFLQPDLGSALVVFSIFLGIFLFSGIKLRNGLILVLIIVLAMPVFWFSLKSYQKTRAVHFLNPYSDPLGEGYNVIQAKITVGSGGLLGRGLGKGTQSHLFFLPERQTDFVFASLSEELGFLGSALVLLAYLALLLRALKIAKAQKQRENFLLAIGIFSYIFFQVTVNVGMNMGILPITGITLPLISYGGSSLLATLVSLGILENLAREGTKEEIIEIR